jgi:hypothetical protein
VVVPCLLLMLLTLLSFQRTTSQSGHLVERRITFLPSSVR